MPLNDKEKRREYEKNYRRRWIKGNRERHRMILRNTSLIRRRKIRTKIIRLLGGQCVNPFGQHDKPYTDVRALQIDHVYGDGCKRKNKGSEEYMKQILLEIEDGSKDYQLLCANCNWIKRYDNREDGTNRKV